MKERLAGYRITEFAPGFFYLDLAYRQYSWWPWTPRVKWRRLEDWDRARPGSAFIPDKVFKSIRAAEEGFERLKQFPRVVKEQPPPSVPSDYFTGPG